MSAPLILAIQPDRRQASQLASIVRGIAAELVLTESAKGAVALLGERLPDLILTPALLSHKDETALTERLRKFGDAAAHIQTLTLPILETAAKPSSKGVLSSLRKTKRKGKAGAADPIGCTADTFAEQVSIYLNRAIEARRTSPALQAEIPATAPAPEPAAEPLQEPPTPQPEPPALLPEPAIATRRDHSRTNDRLPTIEELSARTPAVPEPDRSAETGMDAIAVIAPDVSAMPAPPAASVDTRMDTIAAMVPVSTAPDDRPVPMPAGMAHVAEVVMEWPAAETATADVVVPVVPAPAAASADTSRAIAAIVPVASAAADERPVPVPAAMPAAADLPMELSSADMTASVGEAMPAAPEPHSSADTSRAIAAIAPAVSAAANERPVPIPAAMPAAADLSMELSSAEMTASVGEAAPAAPEPHSSVDTNRAISAIMPAVSAAADECPVPIPAAMPAVAELSMELSPAEVAAWVDDDTAPVVPEPAGAIDMNMATVAAMVPLAITTASGRAVPMPPAAMSRVGALPIELLSMETAPVYNVPVVPDSAGSAELSIQVVAGLAPLLNAATEYRPVPVPVVTARAAELPMMWPRSATPAPADYRPAPAPAVTPRVAELQMELGAAISSNEGLLQAPEPPYAAETSMAVAVPAAPGISVPAEERPVATAPSVTRRARKASKKKNMTPDARKARRLERRNQAKALSSANLFDPDECRFSAL
ncbi:MAG: hypothetical protein ACRD3C_22285, partial [Vicinamibacterales bacterium]